MSRSEDFAVRALETARRILDTEAQGILAQRDRLGDSFVSLVQRLLDLDGHLAITGVGKSGIIGEKISATLSSTGTPSFFLKPVEALHGDLGMLRPGDLLLALSNSGETHEVLSVVHAAKALGTEIVSFTGVEESTLARDSSIVVNTGVAAEACPLGLAPTASTTVTLAVGDALAMVLLEERGFSRENYAQFHPGGSLGQRLRYRVRDLLRSGDLLPVVQESATVREALEEMTTRENLGITLVSAAEKRLTGVLTDGDLRRILLEGDPETVLSGPVRDVMGKNPRTIDADASAADALQHMEKKGITALAVVDPLGRIEGVIHLHDILGRGTVVL
ncbi:MAG: KpsF/GutQ family sugar-phosphate isomerase [Planctomycetota bacterium]